MTYASVKLGEVIDITSGFAFKSSMFCDDGGLPLIRIRDVQRGFSKTRYDGPFDQQFVVDKGDLLVSMDGEFRAAMWSGEKALLNQRVCRLEPDLSKVDSSYLLRFVGPKLKEIEDHTPFVTVKHLSAKSIRDIDFSLPPLAEQRRIAAILDKADAIRKKRQQAIALTEDFLRSAFLEMFGDPVTNPKGWEIVPFGDVGAVQGGLQVTTKRKPNPLVVPYLRVANVYRDHLVLDEVKDIRVTPSELERVRLKKGDILIVEGHGNPNEIGRSSVWNGSIVDCVHQNHLIRVRVDNLKVNPEFVSIYLNSPGGRRQLFRFGKTTSGLNTISTSNVKNTQLLLPPIEKQEAFMAITTKARNLRAKMGNGTEVNQSNLFNSLVQRAFRGELCSGQLFPDSSLSFSSATVGATPPLFWCGRYQL